MAEINKDNTEHSSIENVGEAFSKAEHFIEKNQKLLTIIVLSIVIVVGGFFAYKKLYLAPLEKEAQAQMFVAEQYFEKDSFNIALNGDGNNFGFLKIIDEYGLTNAGNLAQYYAGICYLQTGKFQKAIDNLEKFSADDKLVSPIAIGAMGDAYVELGNKEKALSLYLKAAKKDNEFTSPIYYQKAGNIAEQAGNYKEALDAYNVIKEKYPQSYEGRQIVKYITRAQLMLDKK
jgi:tetratricopeptide (TPR) repeat protein